MEPASCWMGLSCSLLYLSNMGQVSKQLSTFGGRKSKSPANQIYQGSLIQVKQDINLGCVGSYSSPSNDMSCSLNSSSNTVIEFILVFVVLLDLVTSFYSRIMFLVSLVSLFIHLCCVSVCLVLVVRCSLLCNLVWQGDMYTVVI